MVIPNTRINAVHDFHEFRQRAWWHHLSSRLAGKCPALCPLDTTQITFAQAVDRGTQTIPLDAVVGSVNRSEDFDGSFRPRVDYLRDRWIAIHLAYLQGEALPAIEVYRVGDDYYVSDGHHRVSVMRYHRQEYVEAHVIELRPTTCN